MSILKLLLLTLFTLTLTGCATGGRHIANLVRELAKDPASVDLTVTGYGVNIKLIRTNPLAAPKPLP